ncbi:MAG: EF-P lysine aminoacylase GenX [Chromatiales bacterium]|nr:EF-P lysine aminoacylase GenX [Chromatiales bacterium]
MSDLDWRPACSVAALRRRAILLAAIREFFAGRDVLEVDTPILSRAGNPDPNIEPVRTSPGAGLSALCLATSPEFAMKRLLAAGSGAIYQIAHAFRAGERGRWHNPEFSILEWYRPGFSVEDLVGEIDALLDAVGLTSVAGPMRRIEYRDAFVTALDVDPLSASLGQLARLAPQQDFGQERETWLDYLFSHRVQPTLAGRVCVSHWPASQAALARLVPGRPELAERFEIFVDGLELANGFHELADAAEQRRRFESDRARRAGNGQPDIALDEALLAALGDGFPDCSGVALGLDRLLVLLSGAKSLDDVLAFPIERA